MRTKKRPRLDALIEAARAVTMTAEEKRAQRVSYIAGEIGLAHPDWTPEECRRRAEEALSP